MYVLDPLYCNSTGAAYTVKSYSVTQEANFKIQVQIGDIGILMDIEELRAFLSIIRSAKKGCQCKDCKSEISYKTIKCSTPLAEIIFKVTPSILSGLEELVLGILFYREYNGVLAENYIE